MKNILNKIKDINQVLLFLIAIAALVAISNEMYRSLFRQSYQPTPVKINDSNKSPNKNLDITYDIKFDEKIKDTYIFKIKSDTIDSANKHQETEEYEANKSGYGLSDMYADSSSNSSSSSSSSSNNTINMLFVSTVGKKRILLEKDALISKFDYAKFETGNNSTKLDKNIYQIVNDSNNDGLIDGKDDRDLYVSSYNGENLTLVLKDIAYYRVIEDNLLLIQQRGPNGKFYTYKINDSQLSELDTQISPNASNKKPE